MERRGCNVEKTESLITGIQCVLITEDGHLQCRVVIVWVASERRQL